MTPEQRAGLCAEAMLRQDAASRWMGFRLADIRPGRASVEFLVAAQHLNGHGSCHGGILFALADTAFALACNSYNVKAVAHHASMTYLAPGQPDDWLTATANEVSLAGRTGVYDVMITTGGGQRIAVFRGVSRTIGGTHFNEDPGPVAAGGKEG